MNLSVPIYSSFSKRQQILCSITILILIFGCHTDAYSFSPPTFHRRHLHVLSHTPSFNSRPREHITPSSSTIEMKVGKGKSKHSKSNTLYATNEMRKRIAGRRGTKHFLDPNKVFIGNLPYDATEDDVRNFLRTQLGGTMQSVESFKLIRDWKTNKSKGYGFINFVEPMYATAAMDIIKGKKLNGRIVNLNQGQRKEDEDARKLFVKKRIRDFSDMSDEDKVIDGALDDAEGLVLNEQGDIEDEEYTLDDFDDDDDALLLADEDDEDDDEDEFDGIFEEIYGTSKWEELDEEEAMNMNREQRRDAARRRPRKKLPHKGFG